MPFRWISISSLAELLPNSRTGSRSYSDGMGLAAPWLFFFKDQSLKGISPKIMVTIREIRVIQKTPVICQSRMGSDARNGQSRGRQNCDIFRTRANFANPRRCVKQKTGSERIVFVFYVIEPVKIATSKHS